MNESNNERLLEKIEFYRINEIKAHVKIIPTPKFRNGLFVSKLQTGKYFWFIELKSSIPIRLFLNDIIEIDDYIPPEDEWNKKGEKK